MRFSMPGMPMKISPKPPSSKNRAQLFDAVHAQAVCFVDQDQHATAADEIAAVRPRETIPIAPKAPA
jgi:hypothetical protein